MNVILGSGIIGGIAKVLFPNYTLIPFKKSRFFSFDIPFADNYIKYDIDINQTMLELCGNNSTVMIKQGLSYEGKLLFDDNAEIKRMYFEKVYGDYPDVWLELIKPVITAYKTDVLTLHKMLQSRATESINQSITTYGELSSIQTSNHELLFVNGRRIQYDSIISTIPLNALLAYCSISNDLKSKAVCYYLIATKKIDLEGAEIAYVVDKHIDFFKVVKFDGNYLFWTFDKIENPYNYFGSFLNYNLDILYAIRIDAVIPLETYNLDELSKSSIYPVGSNAQWDDFVDINAAIRRLLRLRNKT